MTDARLPEDQLFFLTEADFRLAAKHCAGDQWLAVAAGGATGSAAAASSTLCSVWGGASRPQVRCRHHTPSPHTTEPPTIALARSFDIHNHQMLALVSRMQLQRGIVSPLHNGDRQQ